MTTKKNWTAEDLEQAIRRRYPSDAYAVLTQVANGTGGNKTRTADVVVISLWPSRGLTVEGIEIKVSATDWKREVAKPHKAAAFIPYCNRWWIAAPKNIIDRTTIPAKWGLLELDGRGLSTTKPAPELNAKPMPWTMTAAVLRNVAQSDEAAIARRINDVRREARESAEALYKQQVDNYRQLVDDFHQRSGIRIDRFDWEEWADAIARAKEDRDLDTTRRQLEHLKNQLDRASGMIDDLDL